MITENIKIPKEVTGRYLSQVVYNISQVPVDCFVKMNDRQVNGKSLLGLLSLDLHQGDVVEVIAYTDDAYDIKNVFVVDNQ